MNELQGKEDFLFKLRSVDNVRMRYDPILRKHYENADKIVISAPYMKDVLPRQYIRKCAIVPGTAVPRSYIKSVDRGSFNHNIRLMFVGRIVSSKGIELLIHAIARCRCENIVLSIYGKGSLEPFCRSLAEKLGVSSKTKWKGFVPQEEVIKAYAQADVFTLPTIKEPAGVAVLEAMVAGLPVVCVDIGGPAYSVDESCGIKVPLADKEEMIRRLSSAIDFLAANPRKRLEMGKNAQERIRCEFSWDVVVEKMLKVYDEVISENKN